MTPLQRVLGDFRAEIPSEHCPAIKGYTLLARQHTRNAQGLTLFSPIAQEYRPSRLTVPHSKRKGQETPPYAGKNLAFLQKSWSAWNP